MFQLFELGASSQIFGACNPYLTVLIFLEENAGELRVLAVTFSFKNVFRIT